MKHVLPLIAVVATVAMSSGCRHVTTKVPGVLDLRSDGSSAELAKDAPKTNPQTTRTGLDSIIYGDGVAVAGSDITIVDRKYWVLGLIGVLNESATEEISAALGEGAMKNVKIGDSYTATNILIRIVGPAIPIVGQVLGWIVPPYDVTFSGTRIVAAPGAPAATPGEPPPPTGTPPPPADAAPPPAGTAPTPPPPAGTAPPPAAPAPAPKG